MDGLHCTVIPANKGRWSHMTGLLNKKPIFKKHLNIPQKVSLYDRCPVNTAALTLGRYIVLRKCPLIRGCPPNRVSLKADFIVNETICDVLTSQVVTQTYSLIKGQLHRTITYVPHVEEPIMKGHLYLGTYSFHIKVTPCISLYFTVLGLVPDKIMKQCT